MVPASFLKGNNYVYQGVGPGFYRAPVDRSLILVLLILTMAPSMIISSFDGNNADVVGIQPSYPFLKDPPRGTTGLALLPASPDCWLEALQSLKIRSNAAHADDPFLVDDTLAEDGSKVLNSMTCRWLTSEDQKALALELSKCHMRDLGRPLFSFDTHDERKECLNSLRDYRKNLETVDGGDGSDVGKAANASTAMTSICLKHLTDAGVTTYTHFFSYANQLCTRLLSEVVLGQYYETSHHLAKSSRVAQSQMQTLIEQQDTLFARWNEREEHVLNMFDQLETHVEYQTIGLESKIGKLHRRLDEEHQSWTAQYERFQEALVTELKRHQEEIDFLTNVVRQTQKFIHWPWHWNFGLKTLWHKLQMGYSMFRGVIYNTGGTFCIWVLTLPRPFRWMRGYMLTLLMTELLVEIGILLLVYDDDHDSEVGSFRWRAEYHEQCNTLRSWLFHGNFNFFAVGILFSALRGWRRRSPQPEGVCPDDEVEAECVRPDDEDDEAVEAGGAIIVVDEEYSEEGDPPSFQDEISLEHPTACHANARQGWHSQPPMNPYPYFLPIAAMPPRQYYATQPGEVPVYPVPFLPPVPPRWYDSRTHLTPLAANPGEDSNVGGGTADADRLSRESTGRATAPPVPPHPHVFHPWIFPYQMVPDPSLVHPPHMSPAMSREVDSTATTTCQSPVTVRTNAYAPGGGTPTSDNPLGELISPPRNDGDDNGNATTTVQTEGTPNGPDRTGVSMASKSPIPSSPTDGGLTRKRSRNGEKKGSEHVNGDGASTMSSDDEAHADVEGRPVSKTGRT